MFTAWPKDRTPATLTGDERAILNSLIEFHRETALAKCEGLTDEQLRATPVPNSPHSLMGLLRHLTYVELFWGLEVVARQSAAEIIYPYGSADNDGDFFEVNSHSGEEVFNYYLDAVARARAALAKSEFDALYFSSAYNNDVTARFVHMHLLEEYARHLGHMDMLREALDGKIGY